MPVRRLHSVAAMPGPPPPEPHDPANPRRAFELAELAYRLCPCSFPPGVRKLRNRAEAGQWRVTWEREQIRVARRPGP
jgi:hypothetical protein